MRNLQAIRTRLNNKIKTEVILCSYLMDLLL